MIIGNIPKEIRWKLSHCAQMLIGYIPTTKLETIRNKAAHCRAITNVFHFCMQTLLEPITSHGKSGLLMMSSDGVWHRCHPILSNFIGDYPEQSLVTCTYYGECPKCEVPVDWLGYYYRFSSHDYGKALKSYALADNNVHVFNASCRINGIKPVYHPFWESLPYLDIYTSITPDILHQLLQGVMKHFIAWVSDNSIFGWQRINVRCRLMPPNHQTVLFPRGISSFSCVSDKEHKNICRVLLGLIVDHQLADGSSSVWVLKAVCSLLNFLYLAQLPSQSTDTISRLEQSLATFHENKDVFVDLGVRNHFNVPKIHSLLHYCSLIILFGTTDNYNTEQTERLHIDFTKDTYRATNHRDVYNQMTTWLERHEKLQRHAAFIKWQQQEHLPASILPQRLIYEALWPATHYLKMAQNPTVRNVCFNDIVGEYGAIDFQDALGNFLVQLKEPHISGWALHVRGENTLVLFHHVPVFYNIKFRNSYGAIIDAIHVQLKYEDKQGRIISMCFDTALVQAGQQSDNVGISQSKN